ncbi:hypothetical protein KFK09_004283 [Dendrobium nobile]|uniref:3-ketoacyl-CoA synthase n=1 Tax=Dendrobium nobile TaxID=94219 RepID=A0A8T3C2C8_DENNO|nr:hypothetical protein KFK09_004283 [Dendrobium nobile]
MEDKASVPNKELKIPSFIQSVKLKYVKLVYHYLVSNAMYLFLLSLLAAASVKFPALTADDFHLLWNKLQYNLVSVVLCSALIVFLSTIYFMKSPRPVYLLDFACYKAGEMQKCTREGYIERAKLTGAFTEESLAFQERVIERSGLGQSTYFPESNVRIPANPCMMEARKEAQAVMFGAIDELLAKTGVKAKDIGILIVNCSLFNPTPSLSSMLVNHYKLRDNILTHNLGGMGCSAGLISIDLGKHLLQVHRNSYCLIITTEILTLNWYLGNTRSMLLPNCLFRVGGAAVLLSNIHQDRRLAKYQLLRTVRTHKGSDNRFYNCIFQSQDPSLLTGLSLSKDLMSVAGEALKTNITTLGPFGLPLSEQLLFFASLLSRRVLRIKSIRPYIPDFKLAFEHLCIHAGGRGVLDELKKNLRLTETNMEPSRMTLYRFGNTSSSSLWYELAYTEAKGRMKKGDRTWQIALGSGFKCNSAVWKALRMVEPVKEINPWMDEIDSFPVRIG